MAEASPGPCLSVGGGQGFRWPVSKWRKACPPPTARPQQGKREKGFVFNAAWLGWGKIISECVMQFYGPCARLGPGEPLASGGAQLPPSSLLVPRGAAHPVLSGNVTHTRLKNQTGL